MGECVEANFICGRKKGRVNPFVNWLPGEEERRKERAGGRDERSREERAEELGKGIVKRVRAKVIIGADGIHSVCRKVIYREAGGWDRFANPVYSGMYLLTVDSMKFKPDPETEKVVRKLYLKGARFTGVVLREQDIFEGATRFQLANVPMGVAYFTWIFVVFAMAREDFIRNAAKEEVINYTIEKAEKEGFSKELLMMFRELCMAPDVSIAVRPLYVVPATHPISFRPLETAGRFDCPEGFQRPWSHGRVVLVGDSAHASPPFMAQGTSSGFEDAVELITSLEPLGLWKEANEDKNAEENELERVLKDYERVRVERVSKIQQHTLNRLSEYDRDGINARRRYFYNYTPVETGDARVN